MDEKNQKRGKEENKESPILIYMTSCRKVKGREIVREVKRKIRIMKTWGDILIG
jgi:hypothetical protein